MSQQTQSRRPLGDIEAFVFDVFGTVANWRASVVKALRDLGKKHGVEPDSVDWNQFAQEWRNGYLQETRRISQGGTGTFNVDVMHRQLLDQLVTAPEWSRITSSWSEEEKRELNLVWHRLEGWPDIHPSLAELKKHKIVVALSNGNLRLLVDMARHADFPWDTIISTELFNTFKPNAKAYTETMRLLALPPEKCAMVASHMWDLRGAGSQGMTTVYIPRPDEDQAPDIKKNVQGLVKTKEEGGEVDYVLESLEEVVRLVKGV